MGKLQIPGPTETPLPLSYGDTLRTRVGGGVAPPRKKTHLRLGIRSFKRAVVHVNRDWREA